MADQSGIPNFWLTILQTLDTYDYAVRKRDEHCLKYLSDIRCHCHTFPDQSTGFMLEFHFQSNNPYFTESILTKAYSIRYDLNSINPYRSYNGPEVDRCYGCSITWTANHDLTRRMRIKHRRNKLTGEIRSIHVEEQVRSFFDFFSSSNMSIDDMTDNERLRLEVDIEFGLLLKQRVLPRAVLYFTGDVRYLFTEQDEHDQTDSSDSSQ
jgi:nucleosome assembly protein 1-like 1